ncbi:MAG: DNA cytosine methyltransferase [Lachnospiraceae bacterium]|nr:DNA cytosine methyltransferase [Lachnospiraceae bacterium]
MRISGSTRGLTFSFHENECFQVGTKYRYVLDKRKNEIIILPDEAGKLKVSQKGAQKKPLFDIRNKEVKEMISAADYIEIEFLENQIIAHIICLNASVEGLSDRELVDLLDKQGKTTIELPEEILQQNNGALKELLTAAGLFSEKHAEELSYVFDVASLFSGAGLLDYPFKKDPSFDIKFACDFDKSACETYRQNIGDHILCMDMRELEPEQVPYSDVIIGGPCCQGYSNANRALTNGAVAKQKRLLIDDYIRIVKAKKPLVFVIENVPQFITKENGMYLERVLTELSEYEITYQVVSDVKLGGYTKRQRMILCGSRIGKIYLPDVLLEKTKTAGDALCKVNDTWFNYNDITKASKETQRKMAFVRPGHNYKDIPEMKNLERHSCTYKRLSADEPAITIVNWRKVNIMPPIGNRILSVSEAAALMGLDKSFKFFGSLNDKQQQCGNGVTQAIATFVKAMVKNVLYQYANQTLV